MRRSDCSCGSTTFMQAWTFHAAHATKLFSRRYGPENAEDALQDVTLRVLKRPRKRGGQPLYHCGTLYIALSNRLTDILRHERRERRALQAWLASRSHS